MLTAQNRAMLKSIATNLKDLVFIGKDGLTENVIKQIKDENGHWTYADSEYINENEPNDDFRNATLLGIEGKNKRTVFYK